MHYPFSSAEQPMTLSTYLECLFTQFYIFCHLLLACLFYLLINLLFPFLFLYLFLSSLFLFLCLFFSSLFLVCSPLPSPFCFLFLCISSFSFYLALPSDSCFPSTNIKTNSNLIFSCFVSLVLPNHCNKKKD